MFSTTYGSYTLSCTMGRLPEMYEHYCRHALLVTEYELREPKETEGEGPCFVGISRSGLNDGWPILTVAQNYEPDCAGFHPGAILVPETDLLMLGTGTRLLAYKLDPPRLLWEDTADCGFWGWERHGDTVVMAAELEMAAWDTQGRKLWSRSVEPPWTYRVLGGVVWLDIMGEQSSFPLITGPGG